MSKVTKSLTKSLLTEMDKQQEQLEQQVIENLQTYYYVGVISQEDYEKYKLDYQVIDKIGFREDDDGINQIGELRVFYRVVSKDKQDDRILWEDTHIGHRYCITCLLSDNKLHKLKDGSKYEYCSTHLYISPLFRKKRKLKYQKEKLLKKGS